MGRSAAAAAVLLATVASGGFQCAAPWDDVCPPAGIPGDPACGPYAPPLPPGADLLDVRRRLVAALFGGAGELPTRGADAVLPVPGGGTGANRGCWCATLGNCAADACAWSSNASQVVFSVAAPLPNGSALVLNSTAWWTRNTSGVAPSTYIGEFGPPAFPSLPQPATRNSDVLVVWHQGHNAPCEIPGGDPDYDGVVDYINQLGYDVLNLHMPTFQLNAAAPPFACNHSAFAPLEAAGVPVFRFFLEPVVRAVNFALEQGYARVAMAGLSGGGWSTALAAAIDPRIQLSVPVAGSLPCDFRHTSWDFEQQCSRPWAAVANYSTLYALAALEPERASVQVLHEQDPCCFHGCGRHDRIRAYNADVAAAAAGLFQTVVTTGNVHEVNPRDRVVLAALLDRLRVSGRLLPEDVRRLPFNTLEEW